MSEKQVICPECKQRYDDDVSECIFCNVPLIEDQYKEDDFTKDLRKVSQATGSRVTTMDFEREHFFNDRQPIVSVAIIAICIATYLGFAAHWAMNNPGDVGQFQTFINALSKPSSEYLFHYGASFGPANIEQPWRLLTAGFLHGGLMHIMMNMWCIYALGFFTERMLGNYTYAIIFLCSAVAGNILGTTSPQAIVSVGASGGISGIFGALFCFFLVHKKLLNPDMYQRFRKMFMYMIILTVVIGFIMPNIDNRAHLGGFLMGIFMAFFLKQGIKNRFSLNNKKLLSYICALIVLGAGFTAIATIPALAPEPRPMANQLQKFNQLLDIRNDYVSFHGDAFSVLNKPIIKSEKINEFNDLITNKEKALEELVLNDEFAESITIAKEYLLLIKEILININTYIDQQNPTFHKKAMAQFQEADKKIETFDASIDKIAKKYKITLKEKQK